MTTKLVAFTAAASLAIPGVAGAQAVNGYRSAGGAAIVEENGVLQTHYGGGIDLVTRSGIGASIEAGRAGRDGVWINHVSVDGTYHWGTTAGRVTPVVAGGYSRFFAEGEGANPFNIGGGVDVCVEPPSTQHGYAALCARLLSKRFAAAPGYSTNGSLVADGVRRTHQLSGVFASRVTTPVHVLFDVSTDDSERVAGSRTAAPFRRHDRPEADPSRGCGFVNDRDPAEIRFGSDRLAPTFMATRESQRPVGYARSFEQLKVFVGPGDTISVREASGEEFRARIADLSATELVVIVDGRRRAFQGNDVLRIRQRRGDSLANGTWLGFGIGAGVALVAVATDDSGFVDTAGFAVLLAGIYGGVGAGIGVGIDALIRHRQVIYDHQPAATPDIAIVPFIGAKSAGAMVAVRF